MVYVAKVNESDQRTYMLIIYKILTDVHFIQYKDDMSLPIFWFNNLRSTHHMVVDIMWKASAGF